MKITGEEIDQIKRLSESASIQKISAAVCGSLSEELLSKVISSYLYFKSRGRPDKDFASYLGTKEIWFTMSIGLNLMGATLPALISDKEFRTLALKTGLNKGIVLGSKFVFSKTSDAGATKA